MEYSVSRINCRQDVLVGIVQNHNKVWKIPLIDKVFKAKTRFEFFQMFYLVNLKIQVIEKVVLHNNWRQEKKLVDFNINVPWIEGVVGNNSWKILLFADGWLNLLCFVHSDITKTHKGQVCVEAFNLLKTNQIMLIF